MRRPYPVQWPPMSPRTAPDQRRQSPFMVRRGQMREYHSPYEAAKDLTEELARLGATNVVITSELPTRNDGLPYADGRTKDPGIAVWFNLRGQERVFACDLWTRPGCNLHAIALSIEAMRGLERWGCADVVSRAFAGFAALPPGSSSTIDAGPVKRPWRDVIGGTWPSELDNESTLAIAKARHRAGIKLAHPDAGGTLERAAELNAAMTEAEQELA